MEVKIKQGNKMLDATIEIVDGFMVVSPKEVKFEPKEVKFEPKDGDVVSVADGSQIFICKYYLGGGDLCAYIGWDFEYNHVFEEGVWFANRFTTEEEKQKLFDKLAEEGYEWKADTKELIKLKWRPKLGETYFSISGSTQELCIFRPFEYKWCNDSTDNKLYELGRCFKNEEECQEFCKRLNDAISQVKP